MIFLSPSILAANFTMLGEQVAAAQKGGADFIHIDVMDGHFVPNISIGFPVIESLVKHFSIPLDVHLMISNPEKYATRFCEAGADYLTFHLETMKNPAPLINEIRSRGVHPSLSLRPATPIEAVFPYLDIIDMVLIMTVEPGYGGQSLIPYTLDKVRALRAEADRRGLHDFKIEIDGGVRLENIAVTTEAGANVIVMGTAVFSEHDIPSALDKLRNEAQRGAELRSKA